MNDNGVSASGISADFTAEGPAFPLLIKIVATLFVAAILLSGLPAIQQMELSEFTDTAALVWGCAALVTGLIYFWMLKSRTSIRDGVIEQTWIWNKRIAIDQIRQAKFILCSTSDLVDCSKARRTEWYWCDRFLCCGACRTKGFCPLGLGRVI